MRGSSDSADIDRGGRWVVAQFALMLLTLVAAFLPPGWPDGLRAPLAGLGAAVALVGALLVVWGWRTLDRAASPYPHPREGGRLIESGPYAYVRHPIYAGGVLFFVGFALATSPVAFIPVLLLAVFWRKKAALEEDLLAERYPDYRDYRARVTGAFIPRQTAREG